VSRKYLRRIRQRKNRIARRLRQRHWDDQPEPMFAASNIHYEMAEKSQAVNCGGIGAMHMMCQRIGLVDDLNRKVSVLKRHLPYHESDHVLNIAYSILAGGMRLEDIELRNDENYLNGLGAQRIPDPTTAGDFTRRFSAEDVRDLMDAINATRQRIWRMQPAELLAQAVIEVDGTIAPTLGECKAGMDISYKGEWGYDPLIITLANTREALYLVNRPGNVVSHHGSVRGLTRRLNWCGLMPNASCCVATPILRPPANSIAGTKPASHSFSAWMPIPLW
jgi:hypothetical protein